MEKRSDPRIVQEIAMGGYIFAWEEYWEEDDAGFCCPDFVWEMHTRLKVFDRETRALVRTLDWDSGQRDKDLREEEGLLWVQYCPTFALRKTVWLNPATLEVIRDESEDIGTLL